MQPRELLGPPARIDSRPGAPAQGQYNSPQHARPGEQQPQQTQHQNGLGPVQQLNAANGHTHMQQLQAQSTRPRDASGASVTTQGSWRSMSSSPDSSVGRQEDEFGRRNTGGKRDKKSTDDKENTGRKKRSGVFSSLFGKRKDKDKKKEDSPGQQRAGSLDAASSATSFESERLSRDLNSGRMLQASPENLSLGRVGPGQAGQILTDHNRANHMGSTGPIKTDGSGRGSMTGNPRIDSFVDHSTGSDVLESPSWPRSSGQDSPTAVSPQGIRLQQIDQKQQQLYQQYLARSPGASPIDASRSYGTQAAATVAQSSAAQRLARATGSMPGGGRPGSIVLNPTNANGGPLLNVLRIFSGGEIESPFTFKTVLLNETTEAKDLVKQALQRFQVRPGAARSTVNLDEYFLTIKETGGVELALKPDQKPLQAFNEMCERIGSEQQVINKTVNRSSVGSISSISSSLSLNPAIARLSMNDFSDDSHVKLFLNKRTREGEHLFENYGPETPVEEPVHEEETMDSQNDNADSPQQKHRPEPISTGRHLSVTESITSPSARFTLRVVVESVDLPDGLVIDSQNDALVRQSPRSPRKRTSTSESFTKLLLVPKSATVAETVELALEQFGIAEGVVDGGDDVEDKVGARRNIVKVRYGLSAQKKNIPGE